MRLIRLGYWRSDSDDGLPDPVDMVDSALSAEDREFVADYLRRGLVARAYLGRSTCRICGEALGSLELSDGQYVWPEGLAHYVADHGVRLPDEFVEHVRLRVDAAEDADIDDQWWRGHTGHS